MAVGDSSTASTAGGGGGCFIATLHNASEMGHGIWQWIKKHRHRLLTDPTD
jgi:mevalonate kinase